MDTMLPVVAHIGDKLKELRRERYLSQRELAEKADVSPATILKLEQNKAHPQGRTMRKLADALGVAPSDIGEID